MKVSLIALLAATGLATAALPASAETIAEAQTQQLLQRCVAAGLVDLAVVQQMADDQLMAALKDCSAKLTPAQRTATVASPTYAPAPSYSAPAPSYSAPSSAPSFADNGGGFRPSRGVSISADPIIVPGPTQGPGKIVINVDTTTPPATTPPANTPPANTPPATTPATPPVPAPAPGPLAGIDARIKSLDTAMNKGIASGALTTKEAAIMGLEIAALKERRANTGTGAAGRLELQKGIDQATTDMNTALHNNEGIPNPNINTFAKKATLANGGAQNKLGPDGKPLPNTLAGKLAAGLGKDGKPLPGTLAGKMTAGLGKDGKLLPGTLAGTIGKDGKPIPATLGGKLASNVGKDGKPLPGLPISKTPIGKTGPVTASNTKQQLPTKTASLPVTNTTKKTTAPVTSQPKIVTKSPVVAHTQPQVSTKQASTKQSSAPVKTAQVTHAKKG
jgi:hypothetical protein